MSALGEELRTFEARTPRSQVLWKAARRRTPYGVHSNYRLVDPYPLFVRKAHGVRLWDVDGNEYLDFAMAFGALVTGHAHPRLVEALREQLTHGTIYGFEAEATPRLASLLCDRFRTERVKLSNTGLDATLFALRFARHATGRGGVLKFEGCYHGSHDALLASVKPARNRVGDPKRPSTVPASTGLLPGAMDRAIVAPFNDLASTEAIAEVHADDLAAVIVEPIPMNMGFVLPAEGFLQGLRRLCDRLDICLIFDEVKTCGKFYGGAEEAFDVRPDLKVLGKAIGGGLPVAAVAGRRDLLDAVEPGVVSHAGTFNANPLAVAAAHVTLEEVLTRPAMAAAARLGNRLGAGYHEILADHGVAAEVAYRGVSGVVLFTDRPIVDWRTFLGIDAGRWWGYFTAMANRGVLPMAPGPDEQWTLSVQHTAEDVDAHLEVLKDVAPALPGFRADVPIVEAI